MLIAHISDPHICLPGDMYQGVIDTGAVLANAVAQIAEFAPAIDLVLMSGDITEHGERAEYEYASRLLFPIADRLLVIPGNHDDRENFREAFDSNWRRFAGGEPNFVADRDDISIFGLDVTIPDAHHGEISEDTLSWLDTQLQLRQGRACFVMMHQPPFETGIPYIDPYRCFGGDQLALVLEKHSQVERVLCGHVHRAMHAKFGGTVLSMAPSLSTAIALRLALNSEPASFLEPPGFLLHQRRPGIDTISHQIPVGTFPGPFSFF